MTCSAVPLLPRRGGAALRSVWDGTTKPLHLTIQVIGGVHLMLRGGGTVWRQVITLAGVEGCFGFAGHSPS